MFTCRRIRKKFYEYLGQSLSITEKVKIEAHLNKCPFCLREFIKTKKLFELLSKNEIPKPTEDFWKNFDIELKAKIASATEKEAPRFVLRPIRSFVPAFSLRPAFSFALAMVLIFVVGVLLADRFNQKSLELAKAKIHQSQPMPIRIAQTEETSIPSKPIILAQSDEELSANPGDELLDELYLLDELTSEETETLDAEGITVEDEIEASDLPYLYELDPQLAEEIELG